MQHKDLLTIHDLSLADLWEIWWLTTDHKQKQKARFPTTPFKPPLPGKTLALIFHKSSTRTRISFEVGMSQLGGRSIFLSPQEIQLGRGESIADTARILSRYVDGVVVRTFAQADVEEFASIATIPVINGLTDLFHPCQIIADLFTIKEKKSTLKNIKVTYVGDGNNVAHSWLYGAAKAGVNLTVSTPKGYEPKAQIVADAQHQANDCRLELEPDPRVAVIDADVVYTDVWASMGQEAQTQERLAIFKDYQINPELLKHAKEDVLVMHCLPAHRGEEITGEVIDGSQSIVFDQAENRLHVQKAILTLLMGG